MGSLISYFWGSSESEVADPRIGLTSRQINLVRECWKLVKLQLLAVAVEIMTVFFTKHPEYQNAFPMFRGRNIADLQDDKKFHVHCLTIMGTFEQAIEFLHDPEICAAGLRMVGERHARRGQDTKPFDLMEPIITEILKTRPGDKCTTAVSEALDIVVSLVIRELKHGIDDARKSKQKGT